MGLSQKLYFGQHNGKLEILKSFSAGMTWNLQNALFNMHTVKKWEKIKVFKYIDLLGGSTYVFVPEIVAFEHLWPFFRKRA